MSTANKNFQGDLPGDSRASFWRLATISKALFLLFSSSYKISSHQSALSKEKTVEMVETSLVPQEKYSFN